MPAANCAETDTLQGLRMPTVHCGGKDCDSLRGLLSLNLLAADLPKSAKQQNPIPHKG